MIGTYNLGLVALSLIVATLASYTALDLASRITTAQGPMARWWRFGGAVAMGTGIWSMHFVGMLAFELPIAVSYHIAVTLIRHGLLQPCLSEAISARQAQDRSSIRPGSRH
jgi:diguanylate cyclase